MLGPNFKRRLVRACAEVGYWLKNTFALPNLYKLSSPERVGCIYRVPSDMCVTDRLMLYALVRGLRPARALEIGVRWGNSVRIIANAMEENGLGSIVGIDPEPRPFRAKPRELHGRYRLIAGYSPQAIPQAAAALAGPIDFVFIDAIHVYTAACADFRGVIPYLAPGAHILFHDAFHQGIDAAIREVLAENPDFVDCGILTRDLQVKTPVAYMGLHLIRAGQSDTRQVIAAAHAERNLPVPSFDPSIWDHDKYYLRLKNAQSAKPDVP